MNDRQYERWLQEFEGLGTDKVRNGMIVGGWEKDKRTAARQWLERRDARQFQSARALGADSSPFFMKLRKMKWWGYAGAGIMAVLGAMMLSRMF